MKSVSYTHLIAAGINMFDHADIYGGGECEELFSKAIDMKSRIREKIIIQSKCLSLIHI